MGTGIGSRLPHCSRNTLITRHCIAISSVMGNMIKYLVLVEYQNNMHEKYENYSAALAPALGLAINVITASLRAFCSFGFCHLPLATCCARGTQYPMTA
jgi:hypothetical protein